MTYHDIKILWHQLAVLCTQHSETSGRRAWLPIPFTPYLLNPLSNWERGYSKICGPHQPNTWSISLQLTRALSLPNTLRVQSKLDASLLLLSHQWVQEGTSWEHLHPYFLCIFLFCIRPSTCKDLHLIKDNQNLIEVSSLQSEFRNNCL